MNPDPWPCCLKLRGPWHFPHPELPRPSFGLHSDHLDHVVDLVLGINVFGHIDIGDFAERIEACADAASYIIHSGLDAASQLINIVG